MDAIAEAEPQLPQVFIDGGRISLVAMLSFLEINRFRLKASVRELAN